MELEENRQHTQEQVERLKQQLKGIYNEPVFKLNIKFFLKKLKKNYKFYKLIIKIQ